MEQRGGCGYHGNQHTYTCVCTVIVIIIKHCRVWFWFHPSRDSASAGDWIGDDIYLAVVLFGVGGTAISVVGLTLLSLLVGEHTVSATNHKKKRGHSLVVCLVVCGMITVVCMVCRCADYSCMM